MRAIIAGLLALALLTPFAGATEHEDEGDGFPGLPEEARYGMCQAHNANERGRTAAGGGGAGAETNDTGDNQTGENQTAEPDSGDNATADPEDGNETRPDDPVGSAPPFQNFDPSGCEDAQPPIPENPGNGHVPDNPGSGHIPDNPGNGGDDGGDTGGVPDQNDNPGKDKQPER